MHGSAQQLAASLLYLSIFPEFIKKGLFICLSTSFSVVPSTGQNPEPGSDKAQSVAPFWPFLLIHFFSGCTWHLRLQPGPGATPRPGTWKGTPRAIQDQSSNFPGAPSKSLTVGYFREIIIGGANGGKITLPAVSFLLNSDSYTWLPKLLGQMLLGRARYLHC